MDLLTDEDESLSPGLRLPRKYFLDQSELEEEDEDESSLPSSLKDIRLENKIKRAPTPLRLIRFTKYRLGGISFRQTHRTFHRAIHSSSSATSLSNSTSSASPSPSPITPDADGVPQITEIQIGSSAPPAVKEKVSPPSLHIKRAGAPLVPLAKRKLRRHETTLWMGEIVSRGVNEEL